MYTNQKLQHELTSFQSLWPGGFCNDLHATGDARNLPDVFMTCIAPYVPGATALEIGPGRGAWTKGILALCPEKIYCLDALSAEHNHFWNYVGSQYTHVVEYHQVQDFSCRVLPDSSIDFLFSYDTFCNISLSGTAEYLKHLHSKLRPGAQCFIMLADAEKYRQFSPDNGFVHPEDGQDRASYDGPPEPGRWYWVGLDQFCQLLERFDYQILAKDVDVDSRDPICHFTR